jgi:stress-induced morphogen
MTTSREGELVAAMRRAIEERIPGAAVEIAAAGGGHFSVQVTAAAFAGKRALERQRMVYAALAPFMAGEAPPVHAVDHLATKTP